MEFINSFKSYLDSKKITNKVTVKNYLSDIRHFSNWYEKSFGVVFHPEDFSEELIKLYEGSLGAPITGGNIDSTQKLSMSSLKRHLSSLRQFSKFAVETGFISKNPFIELSAITHQLSASDHWHIQEFKDYLKFKKASDLTIKNYVTDIHSFRRWYESVIDSELSNLFPSINDEIVSEYKNRLIEHKGSAPRTVNRKLSSLRKYLEFAIKSNYLANETYVKSTIPNIDIVNDEAEISDKNVSLTDLTHEKEKFNFSPIPPVRLFQKLVVIPYLLLEGAIAVKLISLIYGTSPLGVAARKASPLLRRFDIPQKASELLKVKGYEKEFFAPSEISLDILPLHKKIWHHIRFTRPQWYKNYHNIPVVHYIHFAILIIFAVGVAVALYRNLVADPKSPLFAAPASPPRILSFQGRLTDNLDNPITSATDIRFSIYDDLSASGSALLWQENHYNVSPDQDGIFSELLGTITAIPDSVFFEHDTLYLGVTIEQTSELAPRRRIASVPYAANSEALQGMLPITDGGAGTTNVVLALDSSGDLTIGGSATPTFSATGGQFELSGNVLLLSTTTGSNTNVVIRPDGLGKIDLQKPLVNSSATGNITPGGVEVNDKFGILATESAVAAFILNNDGASDLFSASSSGVTRFTIANNGTLTIPVYNTAGGIFYANGSGTFAQTAAGSGGQCLQSAGGGTPTWGTCGSGSLWRIDQGAISPINDTLDLLVGSNATTSAKFAVLNVNGSATPVASVSAISTAQALSLSGNGSIQTSRRNTLTLGGDTTGNIILNPSNGSGRVGINTNSPLAALDVRGSNGTGPAATISANSSFAALVVDNLGPGDLITASGSGVPNFRVLNNGDVIVGQNGAGKITAAVIDPYLVQNQYTTGNTQLRFQTMAASSGDFLFQNQSTDLATLFQAGLLHLEINGSAGGLQIGDDTQIFRGAANRLDVATGDSFNVISGNYQVGGVTIIDSSSNATFNNVTVNGTCAGCISPANSPFQVLSGAIVPYNSTLDFLIGGQATTSAKFAVTGINAGTNPTASISATTGGNAGNGIAIAGNGSIQSLRNNTLTVGGDSTGNISLMPRNGGGNVGIGTASPVAPLHISGTGPSLYISNSGESISTQLFLSPGADNYLTGSATGDSGFALHASTGSFIIGRNGGSVQLKLDTTGNLGIATTTPTAKLDVNGTASISGALKLYGTPQVQSTANQTLTFGGDTTGHILLNSDGSEFVGIGHTSPTVPLDVLGSTNIRSSSDATDYLSIANSGTATTFTRNTNGGTLGGISLDSSGTLTAEGLTVNTTAITFSGFTTNGGLLYTNGSGVLAQTAAGGGTQCLLGGTTPTWGSCSTGSTTSPFQELAGAIVPNNSTLDFLIGGQASTSAKFAVLNVSGSGTPTASVSAGTAGGAYLTATGTIQTTANQSLSLGGGTTGHVLINSDGFSRVAIGNTDPQAALDVSTSSLVGSAVTNITFGSIGTTMGILGYDGGVNNEIRIGALSNVGLELITNDTVQAYISSAGNFGIGSTAPDARLEINHATGDNLRLTYNDSDGSATNYTDFTLASDGDLTIDSSGGLVTIPDALTVSGTLTANGALDANGQIDLGDGADTFSLDSTALDVSTLGVISGATGLTSSGTITFSGFSTNGGLLFTNGSGVLAQTAAGSGTQCLLGGTTPTWGSCSTGTTASPFQELAGAIVPNNSTLDFLIGGQATASAKFAVTGIAAGTNPTASISATTGGNSGNGIVIAGDGSIQSLRNNTLTLGGNTTGNITLAPLNGASGSRLTVDSINSVIGANASVNATSILAVGGAQNFSGASGFGIGIYADFTATSDVTTIAIGQQGKVRTQAASFTLAEASALYATTPTLGAGSTITNAYGLHIQNQSVGSSAYGLYIEDAKTANIWLGSDDVDEASGIVFGASRDTNLYRSSANTLRTDDSFTAAGSAITFSTFNTNGGLLFTNGSGVLAQTAAGTGSQCLLGGTTPTWGACSTGTSLSPFQELAGAIVPNNSTLDFLIGGQATASAKFAVLNVNGSTSPVASVSATTASGGSGNGITIGGDGRIQSLRNNTLTLGGDTTGNILLSPLNNGGTVTINGKLGVTGTTTFDTSFDGIQQLGTGDLTITARGDLRLNIDSNNNGNNALRIFGNGNTTEVFRIDDIGTVGIGTTSPISALQVTRPLSFGATGKALAIFDQIENQDIIAASSGGTTRFRIDNTGNLIVNASNYIGLGAAAGRIGFTDAATDELEILDSNVDLNTNLIQNIGHANTDFTSGGGLSLQGTLQLITLTSNGGVLYTNGSGQVSSTTTGSLGECLQSIGGGTPTWGSCGGGASSNWVLNSLTGTISPINNTLDLLIGGISTASAKFAVTGIAAGTNPTASVSATTGGNTGNGIVIAGDGSIQSLRNNTLTIGGNTTGNISLLPLGGTNGKIGIGTDSLNNYTISSTKLELASPDGSNSDLAFRVAGGGWASTYYQKSAGTLNSPTVVSDGDLLGENYFMGFDGTDFQTAAIISAGIDGTPASGIVPGYLSFSTAGIDGNSNDRLTIRSSGNVGIGEFAPISQLHVTRPLTFGANGKALAIFDQIENQDILTASAGGTTRFTIQNNGEVGIGTGNPLAPLHISGNGPSIYIANAGESISTQLFLSPGADNYLTGSDTGDSGFALHATTGGFVLGRNGGTVQFKMTNAGLFGLGTYDSPTGINPTAKLQVYSSLGTEPAASISARTAAPALLVTNDGVGDVFAASASGSTVFRIKANGDIILGNPNSKVTLPANIDPLYEIDGRKYSTYVSSTLGSWEELMGQANLEYNSQAGAYQYEISYNNAPLHSDLWVFSRITDSDIRKTNVLITPNSQAKTWYRMDGSGRKITLFSDRPVSVTYRLTAPKFNYDSMTTIAHDAGDIPGVVAPSAPNPQGTGPNDGADTFFNSLKIASINGTYQITDALNNVIYRTDGFSKLIAANIKAGLIEAKNITTDSFSAAGANISNLSTNIINASNATINNVTAGTANIASASVGSLSVGSENILIAGVNIRDYISGIVDEAISSQLSAISSEEIISPIASIDNVKTNIISPLADGNVTIDADSLQIDTDNVQISGNASISGELEANNISANQLEISENLNGSNASFSGTLSADRIIANSIDGLDEKISSIAGSLANNQSSSQSAISYQLSAIPELEVGNIYADFGIYSEGLTVLGSATASQLTAMDTISIGTGFIMTENSLNTLGKTLEIQPLRQGDVSFMAGKVKIDTDGNVDINGNLNIAGIVNASTGVFDNLSTNSLATNIISPLGNNDLTIKLGSDSASTSSSLKVANNNGNEVLKISNEGNIVASGAATFDKLNFNLVGEALADSDTTATSTGSAGFATLNRNKPEITIKNDKITKDSLIYITPFGDTQNKVLYLLRQVPHSETADGSFTVGVSGTPSTRDIQFNWLIVN